MYLVADFGWKHAQKLVIEMKLWGLQKTVHMDEAGLLYLKSSKHGLLEQVLNSAIWEPQWTQQERIRLIQGRLDWFSAWVALAKFHL